MTEHVKNPDKILKLYEIYSNDLKKYTTIIWQFPTALVGINILAIKHFIDRPYVLLVFPIVNFIFIFSLFKHIFHQDAIIKTLKRIEKELWKEYAYMIPYFKPQEKLIYKLLKWKATHILEWFLLLLNFVFLYFTVKWSFFDC